MILFLVLKNWLWKDSYRQQFPCTFLPAEISLFCILYFVLLECIMCSLFDGKVYVCYKKMATKLHKKVEQWGSKSRGNMAKEGGWDGFGVKFITLIC